MLQFDKKSMLSGSLAGAVAALSIVATNTPTLFTFIFFLIAATAIILVSVSVSNSAGFIAAAVATVIVLLLGSATIALPNLITCFLPAAWIGHLCNLSRPADELGGPEELTAWYPLPDLLLHLCAITSLGIIVTGALMGFGEAFVSSVVDNLMIAFKNNYPELNIQEAMRGKIEAFLLIYWPISAGVGTVGLLFLAYYAATRISQSAKRNKRPRDIIPAALRMEKSSLYVFGGALFCMFAPSPINHIGAVVLGTFGMGYVLAGFATLHLRLRNTSMKKPLLVFLYITTIIIPLQVLLVLGYGLFQTARTAPVSANKPTPNE